MAQTGVRGQGFKSPRDLTGRMHQKQLEEQKRKQKQEDDIASGKTYDAGFRAGVDHGFSTGWDAGIQFMLDRLSEFETEDETVYTAETEESEFANA